MASPKAGRNGPRDGEPGGQWGKDDVVPVVAGVAVVGIVAWSAYRTIKPLLFRPKHGTYHIEKGDTLYSIALRNGVLVQDLKAANGYEDDYIYAGDVMNIPK